MRIEPVSGGTGPLDPALVPSERQRSQQAKENPPSHLDPVMDKLRDLLAGEESPDVSLHQVAGLLRKALQKQDEDLLPGFIESKTRDAALRFLSALPEMLVALNQPELRHALDGLFGMGMRVFARLLNEEPPAPGLTVGDTQLNLREALTWFSNSPSKHDGDFDGLGGVMSQLAHLNAPGLNGTPALPKSLASDDDDDSMLGLSAAHAARDAELKQKFLALVKRADDLEAELGELIPVPEQVSILDVIREWVKILRALDEELTEIAKKQEAEKPRSSVQRAPKAGDDPELKLLVF